MLERDLTGIRAQPAPTPTHIAVILDQHPRTQPPERALGDILGAAHPLGHTLSRPHLPRVGRPQHARVKLAKSRPDRAHRHAPISSTNSTRSHTRNRQRPAATTTNGSTSAASVHDRSSERCTPSSSRKNTRSSPHVRRATTNTNSRPHHGWNGCVTRTVRSAAAPSGAVAGEGERGEGKLLRLAGEGAAAPAHVRHPRASAQLGLSVVAVGTALRSGRDMVHSASGCPPHRSQRAGVEIEIRRARRVEYISNWPRFLKPLYDPGRSDFPSPVLASVLHAISQGGPSPSARNCGAGAPFAPTRWSLPRPFATMQAPRNPALCLVRTRLSWPPSAQSPFARSGCYPRRGGLKAAWRGVTPSSSLVRAHAPDHPPPRASARALRAGSLQVVASPCWAMALPDVISAILA